MKPNDEQWNDAFPPEPPDRLRPNEWLTILFVVACGVVCLVAFLGPIVNGG